MACAAGPRRVWRRALLRRLRASRSRRARLAVVPRRRMRAPRVAPGEPTRAETLRRLVPGGRSMDYCSLLEETADYIQCLSAQVQLMQTVVDSISH
ncbi:transcription factor IBH1-like [Typha angustifolia]|uniref:transcription factor IBH1-like n=1 Tax=Typha angustifolia TaxID=59011 RepID=UPI003C2D602D